MFLFILDTQPTDIWHDPLYLTLLGIAATLLAGIIGALVAYWIYRRQLSKKEIAYQVISDAPVINIDKALEDRVKITLDDVPVTTEVKLVVLKIWNSGNAAIRRDDYDDPLVIGFDERTVVSWDVLETTPAELKTSLKKLLQIPPTPTTTPQTPPTVPSPTQQGTTPQQHLLSPNFIELPKFLLNKEQSISLTILLKGEKSKISVTGRIVEGVIQHFDPTIQPVTFKALPIMILLCAIVLVLSIFSLSPIPLSSTPFNPANPAASEYTFPPIIGVILIVSFFIIISFGGVFLAAILTSLSRIRKYGIRIKWKI